MMKVWKMGNGFPVPPGKGRMPHRYGGIAGSMILESGMKSPEAGLTLPGR
ncbi:MAG: hypothetical protein AVDCRST_MAG56-3920 [uncultured Cytophagales bacterium]|uniref:Uncharacterized protein n=1 Tax=uncultured Cytophagales bacterium TaxID=158755 RepID=A0A6J4JPD1_9SPHI|nr:MAG: hypothetical protein AVDCRST_MAG56-3920 [uncultured Cytophagales bacterium]